MTERGTAAMVCAKSGVLNRLDVTKGQHLVLSKPAASTKLIPRILLLCSNEAQITICDKYLSSS
jgi:hypothetical protein